MKFFDEIIKPLFKTADESTSTHSSFRIADSTAVGDNPVRELSLDVVAISPESAIVTLAWKDSAEKILEKKTSPEEASHLSQLLATDLAQLVKLTDENKYDEAKEVLNSMLKEYSQDSSTPIETNLPKLNTTQAEKDIDEGLWKAAGQVKLQNIFPSGTVQNLVFESQEDLAAYQGKQKGTGKEVPLWEQEGKGKSPESRDQLSPASLSYEDVENQKEEEHENMKDHIDETIKKELESALQEKAASVFGPEQVELVKVLRKNGRNWDEITKMLTKDFHYDKDATTIFVDQQRQAAGDEGIEIKKEEPSPLKPPENLVSPETHDKLLEDLKKDKEPVEEVKEIEKVDESPIVEESALDEKCPSCGHTKPVKGECPSCKRCDCEQGHVESAKKSVCPECNGEGDVPAVRGGHVVAISCPSCSGDKHIEHAPKEIESAIEEISRADNADIRKVAGDPEVKTCPDCETPNQFGEVCHKCQQEREENPERYASLVRAKVASYMRIPETDSIVKVALELWKYPSNYMGDDLSDYYKGPAKGYDADALDKSNFKVALEMLGGEGNGVLVGSFGGFGGGHEQIFVHKDAADKVAILQDIENKMSEYPVLDDSDYSEAQMEEEQESYDSWAKGDALKIIDQELHRQNPDLQNSVTELELSPELENKLRMVVLDGLTYGDGSALGDKHLIEEADREGLLNDFRNALSGTEVVPEDPAQMKLFESSLRSKLVKNALKKRAADNPLQEPISEEPTMETPKQDIVPFGQAQHRAPKPESWVVVQSDLKSELPAFRAKFVSEETESDGTKWGIVDKDGELLKVEMHRITPETEGAQTSDPIAEPQIEKPQEADIPVTPKMDDFHTSSLKQADEASDELRFERAVDMLDKKLMRGDIHQEEYDAAYEALKKQMFPNEIDPNKHLYAAKCSDTSGTEHAGPVVKHQHGTDSTMYCDKHLPSHIKYNTPEPKESSQDDLLSIKAEVEELLKKVAALEVEGSETFTCPVAVDISGANQLLGHEDVSFMKETAIKWTFELEMREWGVKSVYVSVPDQVINLQYEYFKEESVPGASDDGYVKEEKQVQITDAQVEGLDRTGFDSLAPQVLEYRDGKWVLDFGTSSHYSSKYPRLTRTAELPPEHICEQCKQPMGYQGFLGPVCDKCVRKNHKKVTGSGVGDVMRGQAGPRQIGKVWVKDNYDGEVMVYSTHFADKAEFDKWVASKIEGSTTKEIVKSEFPVAKKASDFEKGISQNKTSFLCGRCGLDKSEDGKKPYLNKDVCKDCAAKIWHKDDLPVNKTAIAGQCNNCGKPLGEGEEEFCAPCREELRDDLPVEKQADEPAVEPKTQYKELKKAPAGVDREKAVPATPELDVVLARMDALEQNLATLDTTKKQILAKAKEEVAKLEQSAERVQMEADLQESINKTGVLIEALESKVVSWRDKIYVMQNQEVSYVPNITPKEMLSKIYAKFEGAEKFVEAVLSGMKSQAVNVLEKTLVKFPAKKSSLNKNASVIDQWNEELLAALKELSSPL